VGVEAGPNWADLEPLRFEQADQPGPATETD
jgi:hypothetical protein